MTATARCLLECTILLFAVQVAPLHAEEASGAWEAARRAYANGHYEQALTHFERARNAGQGGPAVVYNIAVCQYRLEDYRAARRSFAELNERYPAMRSLAQYNLGLVAMKLDEPEVAANHFRSSYYLSGDEPKLRAMSSTMLRRLGGEEAPSSTWLRTVSMRGGYDDNVILQNETGFASDISADSPFVELFGMLRGPYTGRSGLRLDGGFLLLRYSEADEFNQSAVHIGGLYEWNGGDWGMDLGAHAGATTLGGDAFDRRVRLTGSVTRDLAAGHSVALRYRYEDISAGDTIFDGVEGTRRRLDLRYRWYHRGRSLSANVTRETNDRADAGVSPDKSAIGVKYRYAPDVGWGFGIGGELRASDYDGIEPPREEDLAQFDVALTRHTESGWQIFFRYLRADNESSDPTFSYERNQISVGVFRWF